MFHGSEQNLGAELQVSVVAVHQVGYQALEFELLAQNHMVFGAHKLAHVGIALLRHDGGAGGELNRQFA